MPLVRDTLSLENWYNDSTLESTNGTTLDINLSRTLLDIGIDDLIAIQDTIITQKVSPSLVLITFLQEPNLLIKQKNTLLTWMEYY